MTPAQRAQNTINAEKEAKAVADALEKLRRQLDPTRESLQKSEKAAGVFQKVTYGLQSVASMGGQPAAAITAVGGQVAKLGAAFGPVGAVIGNVIQTVAQIPQLFKSAGDSIANYVGALNPSVAQRWTQAWADMSAVIGGYLMPVLEMMTGVVRFFGDQLAGWQPVFQPIIDQLTQIYSAFGGAFGDVVNKFSEIGSILLQVFTPFAQVLIDLGSSHLKLVTDLLSRFANYLGVLAQQLALFFGVDVKKFEGSSSGVAARGTGQTNVTSMLSQLQQRAFALGGGSGEKKDYQMEAAKTAFNIYNWLTTTLPVEMGKAAAQIWQKIVEALFTLLNKGQEFANSAEAGGNVAFNVIKNQLRQIVPGAPLPFGI